MSAKVIVACGSGVATSQTVASKVARLLKEAKVDADVEAVDLKSVDRHLTGAAAYITIVRENKQRTVPVINGIAFLTGMGQDAELAKLIEAIKAANGS
ncbi:MULTISPECIES: PTS sugar transporter subunit IIB [unclassified Actinomyces]|uniref:PTS sugar transporter subunit IIB n=1 Tax=unclassified Actinomyces TaxID=2609248 RepID=UPI002016CA24|nr:MULTISPECIES: PTS sugar transporter subunit IIB [unclassified Actinomyces]MCL3777188.1 PTS sugar transporter subunit IIB [Actinomyces sp. AC-20-1]MCL3788988.1 PTS sugar transporter subunit IIB [Actinomyces sp. 187325]MCL3791343.1 PTS sugar transporter subunit IIB [Actinomyces sp. 186855]MCL3793946.1 PTS sugar transporter subunit IIB [Actinomyces sp. 217892]